MTSTEAMDAALVGLFVALGGEPCECPDLWHVDYVGLRRCPTCGEIDELEDDDR